MRRAAALAVAVVLAALGAARAAAHGGLPELSQLAFAPGDPLVIGARTNFGLIRTDDGGATWGWICGPAYHGGPADQPIVVMSTGGDMVVGVLRGLTRGSERGCHWEYPDPDLERAYAIDVVRDPRDVRTLWTITSSGGVPNRVWRSADEGLAWDPVSEPMPDILFATMRLAASDPMRMYLSGAIPADGAVPRQVFVSISIDGGMTFEHVPFETMGMEENVYLLGVDPVDADHVYARVVSPEAERLVVSDDGGRMWRTMLTVPQIRAFAQTDDGATVWVGGDMETGLYRSEDHGGSFLPVTSAGVNVLCLALRDGELWACTDPWLDGFALGRSADRGDSFEPLLELADIEPLACPTPEVPDRCERLWPMTRQSLLGVADAGVPVDGSLDAGGARPGGGGVCECTTAGGPGEGAPAAALLVVGAIVTRRLRRRRRPSPRTSLRSLSRSAR